MFNKLEGILERFTQIEQEMSKEGISPNVLMQLSKERASILDIVNNYKKFKKISDDLKDAKEMLSSDDEELKTLAKEEIEKLTKDLDETIETLKLLTLPKDPNDDKNVILEIRAGTGGDEASLFTSDLFRMYTKYAESKKWKTEILSSTEGALGGFKEVIVLIQGAGVYSRLKFESGAHRVQRVPVTETQGRVHTSACTVAILPEADDVEIEIDPKDLDISICRASGAGGQHVNTTDSAVRIEHVPTGIVVECQDERSQHKNKAKAMKVLNARILEKARQDQHDAISEDRKNQVGSGDRSERIRTYNFPQGRMTDHRINFTSYRLEQIIEGDLDELLDRLGTHYQAELIKQELGEMQ